MTIQLAMAHSTDDFELNKKTDAHSKTTLKKTTSLGFLTRERRSNSDPGVAPYSNTITLASLAPVTAIVSSQSSSPPSLENSRQYQSTTTLPTHGSLLPLKRNRPRRPSIANSNVKLSTLFQQFMDNPEHRQLFKKFLESTYCHENLRFVEELEEYHKLTAIKGKRARAVHLYQKYCVRTSPDDLGLPTTIVDSIQLNLEKMKLLSDGDPLLRILLETTFEEAKKAVLFTLQSDLFPRFLTMHEYFASDSEDEMSSNNITPPPAAATTTTTTSPSSTTPPSASSSSSSPSSTTATPAPPPPDPTTTPRNSEEARRWKMLEVLLSNEKDAERFGKFVQKAILIKKMKAYKITFHHTPSSSPSYPSPSTASPSPPPPPLVPASLSIFVNLIRLYRELETYRTLPGEKGRRSRAQYIAARYFTSGGECELRIPSLEARMVPILVLLASHGTTGAASSAAEPPAPATAEQPTTAAPTTPTLTPNTSSENLLAGTGGVFTVELFDEVRMFVRDQILMTGLAEYLKTSAGKKFLHKMRVLSSPLMDGQGKV